MLEMLVIGLATAFNFIILKHKFDKERYSDLAMDIAALLALNSMFGGTITGMAAAMVGGTVISLYLLFKGNSSTSNITKPTSPTKDKISVVW